MRQDDVAVELVPKEASSEQTRRELRLTIASAVVDAPGSLTAVLLGRGSEWRLAGLVWRRPECDLLASETGDECKALRARVIAALQAAGKPGQADG